MADQGKAIQPRPSARLAEALGVLLHDLEIHRLTFLFWAYPGRSNPANPTGEWEVMDRHRLPQNRILEGGINKDDDDEAFLDRHRWILEQFAQEATGQFGPAMGCKPRTKAADGTWVDVEGGSYPSWELDEMGCRFLEDSSDELLKACGQVYAADVQGEYRRLVDQVMAVVHDNNQPRWYSTLVVRWEYLEDMERGIVELKKAKAMAAMKAELTAGGPPAPADAAPSDADAPALADDLVDLPPEGERLALDYTGGGIVDISCGPRPPLGAPERKRLEWLVRCCRTLQVCFSGPAGQYPNCGSGEAREWLAAAYSAACDWLPPATVGACEHLATFGAADRNPSAARAELARLAQAARTRLLELHQAGGASFPALRHAPPATGPCREGQPMPTNRPSPQERADAIALEVDRLFCGNCEYFTSNVETFKFDDAARRALEEDATKTSDEAFQAIVEELEATAAGRATPYLTDSKNQPKPGWQWATGFRDPPQPHIVEGWISPDAVQAEALLSEIAKERAYWPGPTPTPATMVTLLAALHDECLRDSTAILDKASGKPLEVAQGVDGGLWALYRARQWCIGAMKGNTDRLSALETYLNHAKADLETVRFAALPPSPGAKEEKQESTSEALSTSEKGPSPSGVPSGASCEGAAEEEQAPVSTGGQESRRVAADPHAAGIRLDILRGPDKPDSRSDYGASFVAAQAAVARALAGTTVAGARFRELLESFRKAYAVHGGQPLAVAAVETGATCLPESWLNRGLASINGRMAGYVTLKGDRDTPIAFAFNVVGSAEHSCEGAIETFLRLASQAGSQLSAEDIADLGVAKEYEPAALWLAFVMTRLCGSHYVEDREDCTLLTNPLAACVRVIEGAGGVLRSRTDAATSSADATDTRVPTEATGGQDKESAAGQEGQEATPEIMGRDYEPKPGEDWSIPMPMAEIARRLELDPRTAKALLAKTGLWNTSRQNWRVRLDTLSPTMSEKVTAHPKKDTE